MRARVKGTNNIIDVEFDKDALNACYPPYYDKEHDMYYQPEQLEWIDNEENADPDYWTRLEHQYAGMAMQGMSEKYLKDYRDYCAGFGDMDKDEAKATMKDFADAMADVCYYFAHALVEKYKKEERK